MTVYFHNAKNISQALNCLVSDFQRGWSHVALFNFSFECVPSAVLRTKSLEPTHKHLDQEVYPPQPPLQSLWSSLEGSTPQMWGSGNRCEAGWVLPFPMRLSPASSAQAQSTPVMNMDLWHWWILKWISNYCMPMLVEVASRFVRKKMQLGT